MVSPDLRSITGAYQPTQWRLQRLLHLHDTDGVLESRVRRGVDGGHPVAHLLVVRDELGAALTGAHGHHRAARAAPARFCLLDQPPGDASPTNLSVACE